MVKLGQKAQDSITGFEGTVTAIAHYLTGCDQASLQPAVKDGAFVKAEWFDVTRLSVIDADIITVPGATADDARPGGPQAFPAPTK